MKKNIILIGIVIIFCSAVLYVRFLENKETEAKTVNNIPRPAIYKPIPSPTAKNSVADFVVCEYSKTPCPKCGKKTLVIVGYNNKPDNSGKKKEKTICENCEWCSFKCPKCGSNDLLIAPMYVYDGGIITDYPEAACNACGWWSCMGEKMLVYKGIKNRKKSTENPENTKFTADKIVKNLNIKF